MFLPEGDDGSGCLDPLAMASYSFLVRWEGFGTHSLLLFAYKNLTP